MLFLCRIFITAKIFTTSTHTNYFDRLVKEPGDSLLLSSTIIQSQNSLSTSFFNFLRTIPASVISPEEAGHYTSSQRPVNTLSQKTLTASGSLPLSASVAERTAHYTDSFSGVKLLIFNFSTIGRTYHPRGAFNHRFI